MTSFEGSGPSRRPSRIFGRYLIDSRFQFFVAFFVGGFVGGVSFLVYIGLRLAIDKVVTISSIPQIVVDQLHLLQSIVWQFALFFSAVAFGLALHLSHRIAGPVYRFERTLEDMRAGNLTLVIRIRPKDMFQRMAGLFNEVLSSLRNQIQKERGAVDETFSQLGKMCSDPNSSLVDVKAALEEHQRAVNASRSVSVNRSVSQASGPS